jgi:hypothetical protein
MAQPVRAMNRQSLIVGRGVAEFDRALLNGIECLKSRHKISGREYAGVEFVVGELAHAMVVDAFVP